jgi:hypothetical protein
MLQDQKTQMTHSNNTIIEEVSEQQLHAITGGCRGCAVVARAAVLKSKIYEEQAANAPDYLKTLHSAETAMDLEDLHKAASKTVNAPLDAKDVWGNPCCQHYNQHYQNLKTLLP